MQEITKMWGAKNAKINCQQNGEHKHTHAWMCAQVSAIVIVVHL